MKSKLIFTNKIKSLRLLLVYLVVLLSACTSVQPPELSEDEVLSIENLRSINYRQAMDRQKSDEGSSVRNLALREMALSLGMRTGLYFRSREINDYLYTNVKSLDEIFDFRELILPDRIIPPVLTEARETLDAKAHGPLPNADDAYLLNNNPTGKALLETQARVALSQNNFRTLRITDRYYKIIKQARFAVATPSWRDYLMMDYVKPALPETAILPKNPVEQDIWADGVDAGWKLGLTQADEILQQNIMLLRRDYLGMLLYRKLLAMDMVSAPYVAKRNYGVTGDGDEMKVNDRVLTIAALPALKTNSDKWRPFLAQNFAQELDYKLSLLGIKRTIPNKGGWISRKKIMEK